MLDGLSHLALEVADLDRAADFYRTHLDLPVRDRSDREVRFAAGETALVLRRPRSVPRGGLHTHYAFSTTDAGYDEWWDRLSASFDLEEHTFGDVRALYFYDVDGNCVEIMSSADAGDGIAGLVEVVLEVRDLDRAEAFYTDLGLDVVDRGTKRRRVRLTAGPFDVELWEPQLGLAGARGGVHVDVGFETADHRLALDAVRERCLSVAHLADGVRVTDPDGHVLTFR